MALVELVAIIGLKDCSDKGAMTNVRGAVGNLWKLTKREGQLVDSFILDKTQRSFGQRITRSLPD
eukprot:scaffold75_cov239-Chaetoceros_neogracile.AAC.10